MRLASTLFASESPFYAKTGVREKEREKGVHRTYITKITRPINAT